MTRRDRPRLDGRPASAATGIFSDKGGVSDG